MILNWFAAWQEDIYDIDWEGKKRLIQSCKEMKIQRYVFCSIKDCDKYQSAAWPGGILPVDSWWAYYIPELLGSDIFRWWMLNCIYSTKKWEKLRCSLVTSWYIVTRFEVPLMQIKYLTEKFLKDSGCLGLGKFDVLLWRRMQFHKPTEEKQLIGMAGWWRRMGRVHRSHLGMNLSKMDQLGILWGYEVWILVITEIDVRYMVWLMTIATGGLLLPDIFIRSIDRNRSMVDHAADEPCNHWN